MNLFRILIVCTGILSIPTAFAQETRPGGASANPNAVPPETDPGIPVTDQMTVQKCGGCHKADEKSNLTRISWIRTTPEGWEEAIKRMVRLNGLSLTPEEGRHIVGYLTKDHGVAPEEVEPYRWYLEMRQPETEAIATPEIRQACASCHPLARPQTWHRSPTEWKLLVNMHIGYFPVSENNSFHARPQQAGGVAAPPPGAPTNAAPQHDPVDAALEFFDKNNGLHSSAWSNWRAVLKDPDLKGKWSVSANQPGKGKFFGTMTIEPGAEPGEFKTQTVLTSIATGAKMSFTGTSVIYTGYDWRGRVKTETIGTVRQVMTVAPDQSKMEGRWFWGGYQEFGLNVVAKRESADVTVFGTDITSIHAGSKEVAVKILGDHFPRSLSAADIDLGSGVHVTKLVSVKPAEVSVLADVDPAVISGFRSVSIAGRTAPDSFAVYDKIDYIKVSADSALAHVGGTQHPKGYIQFEAIAFNRGLDGALNTADDINLGPIQVKWSMEEFIARYNDDDKEFVGSLSADGLFTPAGEGPNPQRRFSGDNVGDVWVVAKYQDKDTGPSPLVAKSYLVVTVPVYVKWDQPELAQ